MCLDHRQLIGFSYDSSSAARELWQYIERLISDPENIALSVPGRKRKQKQRKPMKLPPKSQISNPCQFHHITSVTESDRPRYFSLQAYVTAIPLPKSVLPETSSSPTLSITAMTPTTGEGATTTPTPPISPINKQSSDHQGNNVMVE